MKWFQGKIQLCRKCRKIRIPEWLQNEINRSIDLDLPYEEIRNDIKAIADRDLCQECALVVMKAITAANK